MSVATTRSYLLFVTEDGRLVVTGKHCARAQPLFSSGHKHKHNQFFELKMSITQRRLPSFTFVAGYDQCCMMIAEDGSLWAMGELRNGIAGFDCMQVNVVDLTLHEEGGVETYVDPEFELREWFLRRSPLPVRVPTTVFGQQKITQLAMGAQHTLALDECGRAYASGMNKYGQCGIQEKEVVETFTLVEYGRHVLFDRDALGLKYEAVHVAPQIVKVAAGPTHSMIVSTDGAGMLSVWRTGNGFDGRIATPVYDLTIFTQMQADTFFGSRKLLDVECGFSHTAFIVETYFGKKGVMMCGDNCQGQLGIGTKQNHFQPVEINCVHFDYQNVVRVACGRFISLAVVETDTGFHKLYAWGMHAQTSLATTSVKSQLWPMEIKSSRAACCDVHVQQLKCGYSTTIVLFSDGQTEVFGAKHIVQDLDYAVYDKCSLMRTLTLPLLQDDKCLALMMALHVRLGAASSIKVLLVELLQKLCFDCLRVRIKT